MATDTIAHVKLSHVILPLKIEISDAKVFTGRQKPMTEVNFLVLRTSRLPKAVPASGSGIQRGPVAQLSSPTPRRSR